MSRQRRAIECPRDPIGLSAEEAAAFVGVSASTFMSAVEKGLMPEARELFGRTIWDAEEVRMAFRRLPRRNGGGKNGSPSVDWADVAA